MSGRLENPVNIHLRGGVLRIDWPDKEGSVRMTGPAVTVAEGKYFPPCELSHPPHP